MSWPAKEPAALARALRWGDPAVFGRIQDDALLLDVRTLLTGDDERVVAAVRAVGKSAARDS